MMKSPAGLPILQITDPVTPFPLSDQNWEMGVARNWAGFFVINTKNAKSKFKLGAQILFKDGSLREILKVVESPEYLNIYLEGPILNSTLTGYPNKFQVM
jgi:endoglucanase